MGNVPPLVFLHGIGTGPEAWRPQVEAFGSSREVLTPAVAPSLERASFELDALGLACADLCGLSWGSLVALWYAIDRPDRVSRLVLAAVRVTASAPADPPVRPERARAGRAGHPA